MLSNYKYSKGRCPQCDGFSNMPNCSGCGGTKYVEKKTNVTCEYCHGTGEVPDYTSSSETPSASNPKGDSSCLLTLILFVLASVITIVGCSNL